MIAAPRRILPIAALLVLMVGVVVTHVEARRAAPTDGRAAWAAPSPAPRHRSARRRWLPPAALLLAGLGEAVLAGDAPPQTPPAGDRPPTAAEFFLGLDADGDGAVTVDELLAATRRGLESRKVSLENKDVLFNLHRRLHAAADIDGDLRLSMREVEYMQFLATNASILRNKIAAEAMEMAKAVDKVRWQELAEKMMQEHDMEQDFSFRIVDFDWLDRDGDEKVTKDEFWEAIGQSTAILGFRMELHEDPEVDEWLDRMWEKADVSGDGEWDVRECDYATYLIKQDLRRGAFYSKHLLEDMFLLDENGDGRLEESEIVEAQRRLQAQVDAGRDDAATRATVERMQQVRFYFSSADEDEDGSLDRSEARKLAERIASELEVER